MKLIVSFLLVSNAARVAAQVNEIGFEPDNFNILVALESIGFPVSELPEPTPAVSIFQARSVVEHCALACNSLRIAFGHDQVLAQNTTAYNSFTASYWSGQQAAINPTCIFKPEKPLEVSAVVLIARLFQCPFAVKGGGHTAWAGGSSIEDGITISMENLRQAVVSADKSTVDIGPGLRWVDAYTAVEAHGLGIVGGRMAPVGVSGLILGGGISHFANRLGWACDNVASFELVTASGRIIEVTASSYSDLYWALRGGGGGGNFGIVTNFRLVTFPLGQMWGGSRMYQEDSFPAVLDAIYNFAVRESDKDPDAAAFLTMGAVPGLGKIIISNLHYAKPVPDAAAFKDWRDIAVINGTDSTGFRSMSGMANLMSEGAPADGTFESFWDITVQMNRDLLDFIVATFFAELATVADVENVIQVLAIQPINMGALQAMQKNGGNALGLDPNNGPYFILNFNFAWNQERSEPLLQKVISNVINTVKAEARRRGLDNDFIYMNYASEYQDPFSSYGAANKKRLSQISKKYDPAQIFQYLQPGGFKLTRRAPESGLP